MWALLVLALTLLLLFFGLPLLVRHMTESPSPQQVPPGAPATPLQSPSVPPARTLSYELTRKDMLRGNLFTLLRHPLLLTILAIGIALFSTLTFIGSTPPNHKWRAS
jgi:hypothetical protein